MSFRHYGKPVVRSAGRLRIANFDCSPDSTSMDVRALHTNSIASCGMWVGDLGGDDALTEIERHLITSFAGAAILQGHQVAKLLAGEPIEVDEYSAITTSMIRSATRLGTQRRVKDVTPRLEEY